MFKQYFFTSDTIKNFSKDPDLFKGKNIQKPGIEH